MKQGRAGVTVTEVKREPTSRAVNVAAVEDIGIHQVERSQPLYAGRGFEAPKINSTTHNTGSQGKHR